MNKYGSKVIVFTIIGLTFLYFVLGVNEYINMDEDATYSTILYGENVVLRIITLATVILITLGNEIVKGTNFTKPPIIAGPKISESKYTYFKIYKKAKKKLVLCAQNHHFISVLKFKEFKKTIEELEKKNVEVIIFMNDPNFLETATMWETVNEPDNYNYSEYSTNNLDKIKTNNYFQQLVHAAVNLSQLQQMYSNVKVYLMPHVTYKY